MKKMLSLISISIAIILYLYVASFSAEQVDNTLEGFQVELTMNLDIGEQIGSCFLSIITAGGGIHLLTHRSLERTWRNLVYTEIARITTADLKELFSGFYGNDNNTDNGFALEKAESPLFQEMTRNLEAAILQINLPNPILLNLYLSSLRLDSVILSAVPSYLIQTPNSFLVHCVYPQILQRYYLPKLKSSYDSAVKMFLYGSKKNKGFLKQAGQNIANMEGVER